MLLLRLPDGSVREFAGRIRPRDIAAELGPPWSTTAVAARLDGEVLDLDRLLPESGNYEFRLLTPQDPEALDVLRHSCAHVMARAVMRLFPGVKLAFGPTTESGFYYDIDVTPPIREEDFPRIEEEMQRIIDQGEPFERFEWPTPQARALCLDLGQPYKVEHIDEELHRFPTLSFYRQGEFIDLCRGPHLPHAGLIKAFKLLSIAGAYWKNDARRPQLQRLYGTAFFRPEELRAFLEQLEEARKRDHRVLGKQLRLFTLSASVGPGLVLWMPRGAIVRGVLESFIRDELLKRGYQPVYTPHLGRLELYRTSGHFPYYRDAQYPPLFVHPFGQMVDSWLGLLEAGELSQEQESAFLQLSQTLRLGLADYSPQKDVASRIAVLRRWLDSHEAYLVKPMNCPHHIQIYQATPHSYRDLPVRLAEFGTVYRFEQTGELSGMTRVRGFTQDDAHLFVTPEQVEAEIQSNLELVLFVLRSLGLEGYRVRIGLRDPGSAKYVGDDRNWSQAEAVLMNVVRGLGMNYSAEKGEAAFYGPKVDFVVRDSLGREWQLGTVQLDYNLPERFQLEYIGADNKPHRPVMIHRAPFGSFERFVGILIEHFAGAFPFWLAPEQIRILPVSDRFLEYAQKVELELKNRGFRVTLDARPDKLGAKIRDAQLEKIPFMLVIGDKEVQAQTVSVRHRSEGDQGSQPLHQLIEHFIRLNRPPANSSAT
ncbi:MAG: threonine--tRNA ligase [Gemmataceae bacterium]